MSYDKNRRHFWRATFNAPVRLTSDTGTVDVQLIDISLKGALFEVPPGWQGRVDEPCHLKLHLTEGVIIGMWGRVVHLDGQNVGFRCDNIDLDSITHLRRLVELNSGDPKLLEREIQTLMAF